MFDKQAYLVSYSYLKYIVWLSGPYLPSTMLAYFGVIGFFSECFLQWGIWRGHLIGLLDFDKLAETSHVRLWVPSISIESYIAPNGKTNDLSLVGTELLGIFRRFLKEESKLWTTKIVTNKILSPTNDFNRRITSRFS